MEVPLTSSVNTTIPAGYIAAAHLLGYPEYKRIYCQSPPPQLHPNLIFLGKENNPIDQLMDACLHMPQTPPNFGIVFFLQTVLTLFIFYKVSKTTFTLDDFFQTFSAGLQFKKNFSTLPALNPYFFNQITFLTL